MTNTVPPFTQTYETVWDALARAIGEPTRWMYMHSCHSATQPPIHAYKHIDSRQYLFLSDDGRFWCRVESGFAVIAPLAAYALAGATELLQDRDAVAAAVADCRTQILALRKVEQAFAACGETR